MSNWLKQSKDKPLYPELIWSRPENKNLAGRILVIGGHSGGLSNIVSTFEFAKKAGAGYVSAILPDSTKKFVGQMDDITFAPSNSSGGFSREATAELIEKAYVADITILCGEMGQNSETLVAINRLVNEYKGCIAISSDALDYFNQQPLDIFDREKTLIVSNTKQLQKLSANLRLTDNITSDMELTRVTNFLNNFTNYPSALILEHQNNIYCHYIDKISITTGDKINQIKTLAYASVWLAQNSSKVFEAITTAVFESFK